MPGVIRASPFSADANLGKNHLHCGGLKAARRIALNRSALLLPALDDTRQMESMAMKWMLRWR
jgi:hypothetical protein